MDKIRDNIYIGNYRDAMFPPMLREVGITSILNCAYEVDDDPTAYDSIRQVKVGLADNNLNKPYMKRLAVDALKTMIQNKEKILVHCAAGLSRAVYVVCKALSELENKDVHDVYEEVRSQRFMAMYGPLFEEASSDNG